MNIDLDAARVVASASSIADGRDRWTELYVWHHPRIRRCWIAQALGCTTVPGEVTKERRLASASLDRALSLFDDSDLGLIVKAGAQEWCDENGVPAFYEGAAAPRGDDDRAGLAWLLGVEPDALSINAAAGALGLGESSVRMALKNGSGIRVPLSTLLPYVNRVAFQEKSRV